MADDWTVSYYFHGKGKNASRPWVVVERGGEWTRVLKSRGWKPEMCFFVRPMTDEERHESQQISRHMSYRYLTVAELLEDERPVLGDDSDAYRKLESKLMEIERRYMPKAKTKPIAEPDTSLSEAIKDHKDNIMNSNGQEPDYQLIALDRLFPSLTNPRKRFPEASIAELAGSIREKGVLEPLIVRGRPPVEDKILGEIEAFEIVCGERRYRASVVAGLKTVPCLVRVLTDEEVLDIQIHENLHREDVHPMDEAYGYKFLQEQLSCDIAELALRVGKTESYVLNRLKLNQLIPEVQKDIEDGFLPIGHALELAKFAPDSQLSILNEGAYDTEGEYDNKTKEWVRVPVKTKPENLTDFREWIEKNVLWRLAKAPFDRKATNLRDDGLACTACPNRTGANALLFDAELVKKNNDSCLDPACWQAKAAKHVQITRERLAHEASVAVEEVPLVDTDSWSDRGDVLGYEAFRHIVDGKVESYETRRSNKKCQSSITTVDISKKNYGRTIEICLPSSKCKVHFGKSAAGSSKSSSKNDSKAAEAERIKKLDRKEEIFDIAVGEEVRRRVFRIASDSFAKNAEIGKDLDAVLPELLAKLWLTSTNGIDSSTRGHLIAPIMADATDSKNGFSVSGYEQASVAESFRKLLSEAHQYRLLFLMIHGNTGAMYYDSYTSQAGVRKLAEEYKVNYTLLDAQVRVEIAEEKRKKHLDLYKKYLVEVENLKVNAKIPRPFSPNWKPKD